MVAAFWSAAAQVAAKMERMKQAEDKLLKMAREFGDREAYTYKITTLDTTISSQNIPLQNCKEEEFVIHAIHVQRTEKDDNNNKTTKTPLVMQHGYMNSGAYFYRNLVGLTHYFDSIYSIDMLGWGLSSRPEFDLALQDDNNTSTQSNQVQAAEQFFVESLEAWRAKHNIDKMILAGHSMGGYMSVAYCEKYPEHVEQLILLSPVGVPEETPDTKQRREAMRNASWKFWALSGVGGNIFKYHSAGKVLRSMPESWGMNLWTNYVDKRLPAISDKEEQVAISEYLYANNTLPGSGEHCINKILNTFAYAVQPTEFRIPYLNVKNVAFLYGSADWMDSRGGTVVQLKCQARRADQQQQLAAPDVEVYELSRAGHLLMLENWQEFCAAVILGAGGSKDVLPQHWSLPTLLEPSDFVKDQEESRNREQQQLSTQAQHRSTSSFSDASSSNGSASRSPQLSN